MFMKPFSANVSLYLIAVLLSAGLAAAQGLKIYDENGSMGLRFEAEPGYSYKLSSSSDLGSWSHLVSLRGSGEIDWPLRSSELGQPRMFFRAKKVAASNVENLTGWTGFQSAMTGRFHIGLIGDSYTHARDRYAKRLKQILATQYGNLGAGYLGFAYVLGSGDNGSIDETELNYVIPHEQWAKQYGSGFGPDACHVISSVPNATLTVQIRKTVDLMKIFYATEPGTGGFRYRIAGGSWSSVVTDGPESLGIEQVDVQSHTAPYDLEIEALAAGVILIGAEAIKTGDGVVVHKLGATGRRAIDFANNALAKASLSELNLDLAIIMFATNEQYGNQSPVRFKTGLTNIITSLRADHPSIEIVLMLPCYTKYELESPRTYKLQDYGKVMREVASTNHAAFIDFTEVFGPAVELQNLIDAGLMATDRVHPTTGASSGGHLIADTISRSLLSVP